MKSTARTGFWWRAFIGAVTIALLLFALVAGLARYKRATFLANLQQLHIGDAKERVEALLGTPNHRFAKGKQLMDAVRQSSLLVRFFVPESPETWAYGCWRLIRLGPTNDDYSIEFDDAGHVARVVLPNEPER